MAHKVHIGQQFDSFLAFECFKERYQNTEYVQFYRTDSRKIEASAAICPKKTLNPAIKFYEATCHCVRGGKKHKPTGTGKKETSLKIYLSIYLSIYLKHRLWVLGEAVLTCTHNQWFEL